MSTLQLRRFSKPALLRGIAPGQLLAFLRLHADYFAAHGLNLPSEDAEELNYTHLSEILLSPDQSTPPALAEALFYVNELATAEGFDDLQAALAEAELDLNLNLSEELTPADLAVQVWLRAPEIIEKVHAEQRFLKARSFVYFKAEQPLATWTSASASTLTALESALNGWFVQKRRGEYCKVFVYPKTGHVWFLVRHGKPYAREAVIEAGESAAQFFRPEKFDVLAYNPANGELRINAETQGERQLYREEFGLYLFGDKNYFNNKTSCFDLEPLRQLGEEALLCSDVEGIETVILRSVEIYQGGAHKASEILRAEDLFASFKERQRPFPQGGKIRKATFLIQFSTSKTPRTVTVYAGNRAQFKRDGDAEIIELWLALRGFIV